MQRDAYAILSKKKFKVVVPMPILQQDGKVLFENVYDENFDGYRARRIVLTTHMPGSGPHVAAKVVALKEDERLYHESKGRLAAMRAGVPYVAPPVPLDGEGNPLCFYETALREVARAYHQHSTPQQRAQMPAGSLVSQLGSGPIGVNNNTNTSNGSGGNRGSAAGAGMAWSGGSGASSSVTNKSSAANGSGLPSMLKAMLAKKKEGDKEETARAQQQQNRDVGGETAQKSAAVLPPPPPSSMAANSPPPLPSSSPPQGRAKPFRRSEFAFKGALWGGRQVDLPAVSPRAAATSATSESTPTATAAGPPTAAGPAVTPPSTAQIGPNGATNSSTNANANANASSAPPPPHTLPYLDREIVIDDFAKLLRVHRPHFMYKLMPLLCTDMQTFACMEAICAMPNSPFRIEWRQDPMTLRTGWLSPRSPVRDEVWDYFEPKMSAADKALPRDVRKPPCGVQIDFDGVLLTRPDGSARVNFGYAALLQMRSVLSLPAVEEFGHQVELINTSHYVHRIAPNVPLQNDVMACERRYFFLGTNTTIERSLRERMLKVAAEKGFMIMEPARGGGGGGGSSAAGAAGGGGGTFQLVTSPAFEEQVARHPVQFGHQFPLLDHYDKMAKASQRIAATRLSAVGDGGAAAAAAAVVDEGAVQ